MARITSQRLEPGIIETKLNNDWFINIKYVCRIILALLRALCWHFISRYLYKKYSEFMREQKPADAQLK